MCGDNEGSQQTSNRFADAGNDAKNPGDRDQLPRKYHQTPNPQRKRSDKFHSAVIAQFKIVTDGIKVMIACNLPNARPDCECEKKRSDTGAANPPPRGSPLSVP